MSHSTSIYDVLPSPCSEGYEETVETLFLAALQLLYSVMIYTYLYHAKDTWFSPRGETDPLGCHI